MRDDGQDGEEKGASETIAEKKKGKKEKGRSSPGLNSDEDVTRSSKLQIRQVHPCQGVNSRRVGEANCGKGWEEDGLGLRRRAGELRVLVWSKRTLLLGRRSVLRVLVVVLLRLLRRKGALLSLMLLLLGMRTPALATLLECTTAATAEAGSVGRATVVVVLGLRTLNLLGSRVGDGTWNALRGVVNVKALVNGLGDGLDLGAQLLLDAIEVETVVPVDQVDSQTKVTETTGATDTMEVGLCVLGEIKVDDDVDGLNVNTAGQQVGADEVAAVSSAEVVEDAVAVLLQHAGVRVEARVAEFGDFLGEELDAGGGVAEDDGLVDVQAGEEGVQAVYLLLLLDKGVVLGDSAEGELVHEVDFVGVVHVLVHELLDNDGEGGGEEHDLAVGGVEGDELVNGGGEFGREELVGLVHDEG